MLIMHRYTHISIDEEMSELENSLEVQTSPNDCKDPAVNVHKEVQLINAEAKGEVEHFNMDDKAENTMIDKEILPEKQINSCTSNSTMQDLFDEEDQRMKIPKSKENQPEKTEKLHFDDTGSKVDLEESEIKVHSEDKSGESISSYITSKHTIAENDKKRTTNTGENEGENNHKKTDLDEEMLKEESDLQKYCNIEEKGEESPEEAIDNDDFNDDDDDYFIIVNFDSSDEEESGVNMKEDANSKEHETQTRTDLKIGNSNELPYQCTKLELTPVSEVSSSDDAIESVEDRKKITAENNSICSVITDVDNYSTKCDAEGISTERNDSFSENEDVKKVLLSLEMKNKASDAQAVLGDQQITAKPAQCTSKPKTDEILKRNQSTIQTLISQLGLKPEVKTITSEDGREILEINFVMNDKINLKELGIPGTSCASLNTTTDEVSSTISDDLECSTRKGISGQGPISQEIQSPKNSENSLCQSAEEVAKQNVSTSGKPAVESEKQSEVVILSDSKFANNVRKMLDQEEVDSENKKHNEDEEHAATSDVICLSSDDEEQNVSPPAASSINKPVEKQSFQDQDSVLRSNQHHLFLSSPDSTSNKTQFTAKEKEQHSVARNLDLTLTNERTISDSVVSTTQQTRENEYQDLKNRQDLPVSLTDCGTKKENVLNDLPSTNFACASEGLQKTKRQKQLKTLSVNADRDCTYANQSCSTLEDGGSKLPTVVEDIIDDISRRMFRKHRGKSFNFRGQKKSSGRKTKQSLQTNSHNITLTDGSVTVYPEKGENSQQFQRGHLIRNLMTVHQNKTQQKVDSVGLKRKSLSTPAESDNGDENLHILTPQKQLRFDPDDISDLTENSGTHYIGCSELVQGSNNRSTEGDKKSGASDGNISDFIPTTVSDLLDNKRKRMCKNFRQIEVDTQAQNFEVKKNKLNDVLFNLTEELYKSKLERISKGLENSTTKVQFRKSSLTSVASKDATEEKQKLYVYNQSDLDDAVKRLSSVVKAISKRKLEEYGPPNSSEEQIKENKQKVLKMMPAKNVLKDDYVYVSEKGKLITDKDQPESSSKPASETPPNTFTLF